MITTLVATAVEEEPIHGRVVKCANPLMCPIKKKPISIKKHSQRSDTNLATEMERKDKLPPTTAAMSDVHFG